MLKRYDNDPSSLSGVAVTIGPGLSPCLYVGVNVCLFFNLFFFFFFIKGSILI